MAAVVFQIQKVVEQVDGRGDQAEGEERDDHHAECGRTPWREKCAGLAHVRPADASRIPDL
jgi:hypothetical protein